MDVIRFSEQLLASAVGSSSARLILSLLFKRGDSASKDAFRLLDDATEALQHNRDLLQIALDQMEQGITVFDQDFRLTCWNRQYRAAVRPARRDGPGRRLARPDPRPSGAARRHRAGHRRSPMLDRLTTLRQRPGRWS